MDLSDLCRGLPLDPLPPPQPRDPSVPHAPPKTPCLNPEEKKVSDLLQRRHVLYLN